MWDYRDFLGEVLIDEPTLRARIHELGQQISQDYQGGNLLLVCILRGGVMFLTDLMRSINIPHAIEFMAVSSYTIPRPRSTLRISSTAPSTLSAADTFFPERVIWG